MARPEPPDFRQFIRPRQSVCAMWAHLISGLDGDREFRSVAPDYGRGASSAPALLLPLRKRTRPSPHLRRRTM